MRLFNENCIDVMKRMPNNYVQLTVTSPPYDDLRSYTGETRWTHKSFKKVARQLYRITSHGGVVVWVVNDSVIKGSETGSCFKQALYFMRVGFHLHDTMIWLKSNFANPSSTRYHQVFEYMFILSKGKPKVFNPIKDRPNVYAGMIGSYGRNTSTQKDGSKTERPRKVNADYGMRHNVWQIKTAGQSGESKSYQHPAMFPIALAADMIKSWSNKGDRVLDPFMGSGTTGRAALDMKRKFVGIEVSKRYFKIARKRLK
jgi:DNA modification methylase